MNRGINLATFVRVHASAVKRHTMKRIQFSQPTVHTGYDSISARPHQRRNFSTQPFEHMFQGIGKLNHVAIAVPDLEKASQFYRQVMRADVSAPLAQPEHGVTVVFVNLGETKIELIHPLGDQSPIKNFLEKNKNGGIHHICVNVDDIESAIEHLKQHNIRTLSDLPKIGAHNRPVMFLHPKDCFGVLVELEHVGEKEVKCM